MRQETKLARLATALRALRTDVGGAALLVAATTAALIWANLPLSFGYADFWGTELNIGVAGAELQLSLHHLINDGLMTFFFFVVGLEVKRDLVLGELADRRRIAVPLIAAVAGMAVPAAIYVAINWGTDAASGWGTVISTDTAFLLGLLALAGRACPPQLRVLLMAIAVGDDVAALSVIAIFYTAELNLGYLLAAAVGVGLMFVLRWLKVWRGPAYMVLGVASWVALYQSGVHATLLGVAVAFITETYSTRRDHVAAAARTTSAYLQSPSPELARSAEISLQRAVPVNDRMLGLWQPWTTAVIVPLFALANAGVPLSVEQIAQAAGSPVTLGVIAGLVLGKMLGIFAGAELTVRLGLGRLAPGLTRLHLLGGAALAGMGFTISLFIVELAFPDPAAANSARIGILAASLLAAILGTAILRYAAHRYPADTLPERLEPPVDVKRDHIRGPLDAPLTLVEYGDYESAGGHGAHAAVREVQRRMPGQVRFVFRHLVDQEASPNSQLAAEAAEVAGAQGRFWKMHDELFDTASDLTVDHLSLIDLLAKADAAGLDRATFSAELGSGRFARRVQQDSAFAAASGATESPTFFINGIRQEGRHDADTLIQALIAAAPGDATAEMGTAGRTARRSGVLPPWRATPAPGTYPDGLLSRDLEETPDQSGRLPRLSDEDLRVLTDAGDVESTHEGQVLFDIGDTLDDLLVVLSGAVAIVEYARHAAPEVSVHEAGRFLGEVDLLTHEVSSRAAVVIRPGQILRLSPGQQQAAFSRAPGVRERIARTVLLRRAGLLDVPDLRIVGAPESAEVQAITGWAATNGRTVSVEDVADLLGRDGLATIGLQATDLPLAFTRSGDLLKHPGPQDLANAFPNNQPTTSPTD